MKKVIQVKSRDELKLSSLAKGQVHHVHIHIPGSPFGNPWKVPVIVARGLKDGPVLGVTAAIHGNELNGMSTIFKLFRNIKPEKLAGTLIAVPICNVPGYLLKQRYYSDGEDLNRKMPGNEFGKKPSEVYNYYLTSKIIKQFDYLLDLHTASSGKINSLYIRADLEDPKCRMLANLQNPQIIVQKYDEEGTLRSWANSQNIPTITIEIGNPNIFQQDLIDDTLEGITNTMRSLKMIPGKVKNHTEDSVICSSSFWIFSRVGGVIDVLPALTKKLKKGDLVARVYNVFGEIVEEILSPKDGVVIGKNTSPSCEAGSRILHLGISEES